MHISIKDLLTWTLFPASRVKQFCVHASTRRAQLAFGSGQVLPRQGWSSLRDGPSSRHGCEEVHVSDQFRSWIVQRYKSEADARTFTSTVHRQCVATVCVLCDRHAEWQTRAHGSRRWVPSWDVFFTLDWRMEQSTEHIQRYSMAVDGAAEGQKRPLSTPPQEPADWKRQRVEHSMSAVPSSEATPMDPRLIQQSVQGVQSAIATVPQASTAPDPSSVVTVVEATGVHADQVIAPTDLPVVEAMVRREGTDKFKRFPFDPTLNAEQRAERIQDEKKKICPKSAIDRVLVGLGASESFQYDDNMAQSLCLLAEHMLEQTMEFGALMASRRKSKWMEAKDMELYLDRMWQIPLPAFGHRGVSAIPKYNAESTDAKHRTAVRAALSALQPVEAQAMKFDDRSAATSRGEDRGGEKQE